MAVVTMPAQRRGRVVLGAQAWKIYRQPKRLPAPAWYDNGERIMTLQGMNDAKHWRDRAAEMRVLAGEMKDGRNPKHNGHASERLRQARRPSRAPRGPRRAET
jgi:hypothetical protein